jgi:hypothetical protein
MKAELEFFVGGVTTDMVEEVCRQIFDDLADPHSSLPTELSGLGLDGRRYDDLEIEEHNNDSGITIVITILSTALTTAVAERLIDELWAVLERLLADRFGRGPGDRIR